MADASLNPCVKEILCGLSDAVLRTLQGIIDGQVAILQAQIVIIQTQILQYDILAIPVEITRAAAQAIIDTVRQSVALVPLNLISNCVDLGDFNLNLYQSLDVATAVVDDIAFEATRLLSFRDELNSLVNELNTAIDQFTDIRGVIDECLARS